MSINSSLRQLRLNSGMTQEQAAGKLGVTRQALSSYELGRTRPDIDMLVRICDLYGTDLESLIYGQDGAVKQAKRIKITALIVLLLLTLLTLISSLLLWSANRFFPIEVGTITGEETAILENHIRLTDAWENTDGIVLTASVLGFAALVIMAAGKCRVPIKHKIAYAGVLAACILLAPLFFAVTDKVFTEINYYITPYFVLFRMLFFLVASILIDVLKKSKNKKPL